MSEENKLISMIPPRRVLTRTFANTEYKIRIARVITEIDDFEEEIMALEEATQNDFVKFQLSSPGGSLETCDFMCRRMQECQAPIVVEIGLTCASAASAMCLQADDWIIHDSSTMMVHACSYSPGYGKEVDVRASVDNTARINKEWVERTYRGFLTEQELEKVLDGKDLYFYADDLRVRLPKYQEYRNSQPCPCGSPECESNQDQGEEKGFSLEDMMSDIATKAVDQAMAKITKKYDLVAKAPKPKATKKVVDKGVEEA